MKTTRAILFVMVLGLGGTAIADETPRLKKRSTALAISGVCTFAPAAVGGYLLLAGVGKESGTVPVASILGGGMGIFFGPSCGAAYAGKRKPFGSAFGRLGIASATLVGTVLTYAALGGELNGQQSWAADAGAITVATLGGALLVRSCVMDFLRLGRYVDETNKKRQASSMRLAPAYFSQTQAYGATFSLAF